MVHIIPCMVCGKREFTSFRKLKSHLDTAHYRKQVYRCPGEDCSASYLRFNSFRRHYISRHIPVIIPVDVPDHASDEISENLPVQEQVMDIQPSCSSSSLSLSEPIVTASPTFSIEAFNIKLVSVFSRLYANPQLPKNITDYVFKAIHECYEMSFNGCCDCEQTLEIQRAIRASLDDFSSEYKRIKYLRDAGVLIAPEKFIVGARYDFKKQNGKRLYTNVHSYAHFIPLRAVLHQFFSLPQLLVNTLSYMNELETLDPPDLITNFITGRFWRSRKLLHGSKTVIPLFLQIDDTEGMNPLGSHSGILKLGCAYISLPTLPPQYRSKLECIFLALMYFSYDRVKFGNLSIFRPLISEFNYLIEEGILFDVPGCQRRIFFDLGCLLGDNLGLHGVLGLKESFSANFSCRICTVDRATLRTQSLEDPSCLRSLSQYNFDFENRVESITKEKCIWLKIKNFDLFKQTGVDVMHDWYEGVVKYVMCPLILTLVTQKFFTMDQFNSSLATFDFGCDKKDKPPSLSIDNLRKGNLRLYASEMEVLLRYFGVIFGDLVPEENEIWDLYIKLRRIEEIMMAPAVNMYRMDLFRLLVSELCNSYRSLFNLSLKPKFHNLLHYHRFMMNFGPLSQLSSMRFEAKHRPTKLSSTASCNRKLLTYTIALKHQFKLSELLVEGSLPNYIALGYSFEVHDDVTRGKLGCQSNDTVKCCTWVSAYSCRFNPGTIVVYNVDEHDVKFMKICQIYVINCENVVFSGSLLKTQNFNEHKFAYEVEMPHTDDQLIFVPLSKLHYPIPCHLSQCGYGFWAEYFVVLHKPL